MARRARTNPTNRFLKPLYFALGFILLLVALTYLFNTFSFLSWTLYSIILGVIAGVPGSYLIQQKMADKYKFGTIGAFGGMGLDLGAALTEDNVNHTFIHAVSVTMTRFISMIHPKRSDSDFQSIVVPHIENSVMIGIWSFIGLVGLVILFSLIFDHKRSA